MDTKIEHKTGPLDLSDHYGMKVSKMRVSYDGQRVVLCATGECMACEEPSHDMSIAMFMPTEELVSVIGLLQEAWKQIRS